jgi:hypothetical protein
VAELTPGLAGWGLMNGLMQDESRFQDYEEPLAVAGPEGILG